MGVDSSRESNPYNKNNGSHRFMTEENNKCSDSFCYPIKFVSQIPIERALQHGVVTVNRPGPR